MDMDEMLKQAQKLQEDMENAQKTLEATEIEASDASGAVKVKISGLTEFKSISIKGADQATEKAVLEALNKAVADSKKKHEEAMRKITSGLELPGMDELEGLSKLEV